MYCFIAAKHRRRAVKVILHSGSLVDYERRVIISAAITKVLVFIKRATVFVLYLREQLWRRSYTVRICS